MIKKIRKVVPAFIGVVLLFSSLMIFSASASASLINGSVTEIGTGEKSPTNPYVLQGVTEGVPSAAGPLYGDGTVNDTYDPSTGKVTRRWGTVILDSSLTYSMDAGANKDEYTTIWVQNVSWFAGVSTTSIYCSHLPSVDLNLWTTDTVGIVLSPQGRIQFRIPKSIATTVTELKNWLDEQKNSGTPVTVIYPIQEVEEDYYSNDRIQYIHFTGSDFEMMPPDSVDNPVLSGDTLTLLGLRSTTIGLQFGYVASSINTSFFRLDGGIEHYFDLTLKVSPLNESDKSIGKARVDFTLVSADGEREEIISSIAYIDGNSMRFQLQYVPSESYYCTQMFFYIQDYPYTDSTLSLENSFVTVGVSPDSPMYPAPDESALDEQERLEGVVNDQNKQGLDNANQYNQNSLTTLLQYVNGFQAVSVMFGKISGIPFFGALITLSISIGLLAFLLGMVGSVYRSSDSHSDARSRGKGD